LGVEHTVRQRIIITVVVVVVVVVKGVDSADTPNLAIFHLIIIIPIEMVIFTDVYRCV
jgi:hypothetical protein